MGTTKNKSGRDGSQKDTSRKGTHSYGPQISAAKRKTSAHGGLCADHPREYVAWKDMIRRCHNKNDPQYYMYGGRGISVCQEWKESFLSFLKDMGPRPSRNHSIDRIDNEEGYCKANCRWATSREQARNRRTNIMLTHDGRTQCAIDWAKEYGVRVGVIYKRIKNGMSHSDAITLPPQWAPRIFEYNGERKTIKEWSRVVGISHTGMAARIKKWGIKKAIETPVTDRYKNCRRKGTFRQ